MGRNYKSESEWEKKKYDIIKVKLNKELGEQFRLKLKSEHKTIADWMRENIEKYLKEK